MKASHKSKKPQEKPLHEPEEQIREMSDPSEAPEEAGSATQTKSKGRLLQEHKTDESGAPVD